MRYGQDKALYDYTFSKDNGINPEIKLAHKYVSNWEEMKANASGLLIWGDVGTGKSFFAGCIANALLEKDFQVPTSPHMRSTEAFAFISSQLLT